MSETSRFARLQAGRYTFDVKAPWYALWKEPKEPTCPCKDIKYRLQQKALELPGVMGVVTGKDTLGVKQGIWRRYKDLCDEQILL
jgi:4-hydroxybenzoyl-CoA reductase subunit alpha